MTEEARSIAHDVTAEEDGERFDKIVAKAAGISRQRAMELMSEGKVKLGYKRLRKGDRAEPGMKLTIELPPTEAP